MNRTLLIMRHAKSDWTGEHRSDHERPLTKRGIAAARLMGRVLRDAGRMPDYVRCSSARRTQMTLAQAREAGDWRCDLEICDSLYDASVELMLGLVKSLPAAATTAMLVGHEPGCSGLLGLLVGGRYRFATAAVACVDFDVNGWPDIGPGTGELVWLLPPKVFALK